MEVIVYTRPDCESSRRIKEILEDRGVTFQEHICADGKLDGKDLRTLDIDVRDVPLTGLFPRQRLPRRRLGAPFVRAGGRGRDGPRNASLGGGVKTARQPILQAGEALTLQTEAFARLACRRNPELELAAGKRLDGDLVAKRRLVIQDRKRRIEVAALCGEPRMRQQMHAPIQVTGFRGPLPLDP